MRPFPTFAEYLERCDAGVLRPADASPPDHGGDGDEPGGGRCPSGLTADRDGVAERSIFRGVFKVVNPARPVSPTNARLFASPTRKRKLGSQVMGR